MDDTSTREVSWALPAAGRPGGLAEQIAARLRASILSGEFSDGEKLPSQDELLASLGASRSSLRAGLRILEAEGLVSVRRGKSGGAIVHLPRVDTAAYALQLVLSSNGVGHADVAAALRQLEPVCAALCALRPDREVAVLPILDHLHAKAVAAAGDEDESIDLAKRFHDAIVANCGNATLTLVIGALHQLWSRETAALRPETFDPPVARRLRDAALEDHDLVIRMIRRGDADAAARILRQHRGRRYAAPQLCQEVAGAPV